MIPPSFDYEKPASVDDTLALLRQYGADARILAGGQSLLLQLKARTVAPKVVIDIGGLSELRGISRNGGSVRIGALVTQAELAESQEIRDNFPFFGRDTEVIADPMVRRRGTFAGALAFAGPAGDWPAFALVLDAEIEVRGENGSRTVLIGEFLRDAFSTALGEGDLLTHVTLPVPSGSPRMVYRKMRHPASGYALVGVAVVLEQAPDGTCSDCRVGITGAGRRAVRAASVEAALRGRPLTPEAIAQASKYATEGIDFLSDLFAGQEYRAQLVRTYVKRTLLDALPTPH